MESFNRRTFLETGADGVTAMIALKMTDGGSPGRERTELANGSAEARIFHSANGIFRFQKLIPNYQHL